MDSVGSQQKWEPSPVMKQSLRIDQEYLLGKLKPSYRPITVIQSIIKVT